MTKDLLFALQPYVPNSINKKSESIDSPFKMMIVFFVKKSISLRKKEGCIYFFLKINQLGLLFWSIDLSSYFV